MHTTDPTGLKKTHFERDWNGAWIMFFAVISKVCI